MPDYCKYIKKFLKGYKVELGGIGRNSLIQNYLIGESFELGYDSEKDEWFLEELYTDEINGSPFYDSMPRGDFETLDEALMTIAHICLIDA